MRISKRLSLLISSLLLAVAVAGFIKSRHSDEQWKQIAAPIGLVIMFLLFTASLYILVRKKK